jgi:hypothetical protein
MNGMKYAFVAIESTMFVGIVLPIVANRLNVEITNIVMKNTPNGA